MSGTVTQVVIPSNPADQKAILEAVKEADNSLIRIAAERDQIKAIVEDVAEKYELNKKYVRKLIKTYNKQNFDREVAESEDFATLYETIVK